MKTKILNKKSIFSVLVGGILVIGFMVNINAAPPAKPI